MAIEIGEGTGAIARGLGFQARKNVIDASQGGNYSGGSSFPDGGRIPLMPSSIGLAGLRATGPEEAVKFAQDIGNLAQAAKKWADDPLGSSYQTAKTALYAVVIPVGPIPVPVGAIVDAGEALFNLGKDAVDWIEGGPAKRRRIERDRKRLVTATAFYTALRNSEPVRFYLQPDWFKLRFKTLAKDKSRYPIPGGWTTPYSHEGKLETAVIDSWTRKDYWKKLGEVYHKHAQYRQRDRQIQKDIENEKNKAAEVKSANRARESVRNVGMAIIVTAVEAFGDEFRKNPSLIGEGVMAYVTPMRNNPRLQKFDRAQVENLLRSKTNVQSAADTYFKKNPQDKARAFALAVDYKKRQEQLVQLNQLIKAKQKKADKNKNKQKKMVNQGKEAAAVVAAAHQPETNAAKKVASAVGKKARELDKKKNKRLKVTLKARNETKRLRNKVARLKQQLAAQQAKPPTAANVAATNKVAVETAKAVDAEQKMHATNVVGAALTKNTAAQAAIARQLEQAVRMGNPVAAKAFARLYLRLGGVAERLKGIREEQLKNWGSLNMNKKATVPIADMYLHLQGYQAEAQPEYSNARRHVYFSRPMQKWIIVRRRGNNAEFEFTDDCPCDTYT